MKKKILFVASTVTHLENFHMPYIAALKQKYDVYILATDKEESTISADFNIKFEKNILSLNNFRQVNKMRDIFIENKFDAIILNTSLASYFVRRAVKKLKIKPRVINIVHGYLFDSNSSIFEKALFLGAEKNVKCVTDEIIVMNEEDRVIATKHRLSKNGVYKIMGMGISDSRFSSIKIKDNNVSNDFSFTFVGELSKRKNQKFLVEFIKALKNFDINAKLNLIGWGEEYLKKLKKVATKLGVLENINFVGFDRKLEKYFAQTNYYVSSSKIEGMPFNILEAMQSSQVVISANIKGVSDVIDDLENGVLFKSGDINDFVNKFRLIKNNLSLQEKIRKNAIKTVKKYELNAIFNENIELIEKLIENQGKNSNGN